jgi:mono/diheme cytochrome c family protein
MDATGGAGGGATTDTGGTTMLTPVAPPAEPPAAWGANCAACHGPEGEGAELGPEIRHTPLDLGVFVTRNGRGFGEHPDYVVQMLPFDATVVSDDDLLLIFAWLDNFPKPTDGPGLYADFCEHCHGADAASGSVGLDIKLELHELPEKVRGGVAGDFDARTSYMPSWGADKLTDAEIQMISDYVGTL